MKFELLSLLPVALVLAVASSCTSHSDDCAWVGTCPGASGGRAGEGGEGGEGEGGGSGGSVGQGGESGGSGGGSGNECDLDAVEAGCTAPRGAIFVAPSGSDEAEGTRDAPVATLSKAVELAAGDKPIVVCTASYDEHVIVNGAASIYGGFSCSDWRAEDGTPLFEPASAGPALKIDSVEEAVLITNVAFEVPDATEPGGSAVTAIVNASPDVVLRSVSLKAGEGVAGDDGTLTEFEYAAQATLNGNPENPATMGGGEKICECQTGSQSSGGVGGVPALSGDSGSAGLPDHAGSGGEPGEAGAACNSGGGGGDGADAPAASPADGAATTGAATPSGWQPISGDDGETGQPGQGGGGGASRNDSGHGGGGGCGGCGGNGGKGGQGGGGSIALLLIDSPVTLEACTLVTSDAGDGGDGAAGQPGQQDIGAGGGVVSSINSCPGGNGGKGGAGGAGGGGAGGISAGIVWQGDMAPSVSDDTSIVVGEPGLAGEGGAGTNDGVEGVAVETLEVTE